jgi:hypothetical protein
MRRSGMFGRLQTRLRRWWTHKQWGRDDGVCPHDYEADVSGPGDVEGTWHTDSPGEALRKRTVSRVTLRYPFQPDILQGLHQLERLELVRFDAEGDERAAQALAASTVRLPTQSRVHVFVLSYVGRDKPAFLAEHPADLIRWFDCPHIPESTPRPPNV